MRVCINKSTGKLIESQSGGETPPMDPEWTLTELEAATAEYRKQNLQVLIDTAVRNGHKVEDIEAKFITDAEFAEIMEKMKPIPTYADLRRAAYPTESEIVVALWEWVVENRPEASDALQVKRIATKEKYPK